MTVQDNTMNLLAGIELEVSLRFGTSQKALREILELKSGSMVSMAEIVNEPVELLVGGRVIARGELLNIDGNYGFEISELLNPVADTGEEA